MRRHFLIALGSLACAASIGALLRLIYVMDLPWLVFKPWLHAHSHVAMLGWVFPALLLTLLGQDDRKPPRGFLGWLSASQMMVLGMLVSFPLQGYDTFSITFSILQMLISYVLVGIVWISTAHWPKSGSRRLVRLAIILQVISTLGVWAMGPIMTHGLAGTEWYYWSIQWFLHFQFNGWFWFAALALWSRWAETHGVAEAMDPFTIRLWLVSSVLTFALAIAWSERHWTIIAINSVGVLLQLWAGWRTAGSIRRAQAKLHSKAQLWAWRCVTYALIGMGLKVLMQAVAAVPQVPVMAFTIRNYVIGFIHLNMLGAISMMLFAMALLRGWFVSTDRLVRIGLSLFTGGMLLSEAALFLQGTLFWVGWGMIPGYHWIQLLTSVPIPLGVIALLAHLVRRQRVPVDMTALP